MVEGSSACASYPSTSSAGSPPHPNGWGGKASGVLCLGIDGLLRRRLALAATDGRTLLAPGASADVDLLRLHRFGDFADEVDRKQPVADVRALDLDVVGEREAPLERAVGDAAIDIIRLLLFGLVLLAPGHEQHILLGGDVELVGLEPGDCELDAIFILADLDEVERRIILLRLTEAVVLEHVEQAVEPDRGTPEWRKIESTAHVLSSF